MKTDPSIEVVRELVTEIDRLIKRLPAIQQPAAYRDVLATMATMPSQQATSALMATLEPCFHNLNVGE